MIELLARQIDDGSADEASFNLIVPDRIHHHDAVLLAAQPVVERVVDHVAQRFSQRPTWVAQACQPQAFRTRDRMRSDGVDQLIASYAALSAGVLWGGEPGCGHTVDLHHDLPQLQIEHHRKIRAADITIHNRHGTAAPELFVERVC